MSKPCEHPPTRRNASAVAHSRRFRALIDRIDAANRQDPHTELLQGVRAPRELVYSERLTDWVLRLNADASEALRIAARGQHVQRWTIPRDRFARTRQGYLRWRETLKTFHIQRVAELMHEVGYDEPMVQRVGQIMSKRALATDPESQTLEDALCLLFLETQFAPLRTTTPDEKLTAILRKTWVKMSPQARELAQQLPLAEAEKRLLAEALS